MESQAICIDHRKTKSLQWLITADINIVGVGVFCDLGHLFSPTEYSSIKTSRQMEGDAIFGWFWFFTITLYRLKS